jgi:hypothetical protein
VSGGVGRRCASSRAWGPAPPTRKAAGIPGATRKYGAPDCWVWPGPNNNTYIDFMLRECAIHVDLPPTCAGKDYRSWLGASFTSGGTGF